MSRKICIPASIQDPYYRYKRDILQVVYENRNGVQTHLTNIDIVARQLKVPRDDFPKLFKKKLGVSVSKDIIPGRIEVSQLETVLNAYIESVVLCKKCRLPELANGRCNACGVSTIDHKTLEVEEADLPTLSPECDEVEKKVVKIMHELYAVREHFLPSRDVGTDIGQTSRIILDRVDSYLVMCWSCVAAKDLKKIKAAVKIFGDEIEAGTVKPTIEVSNNQIYIDV